MAKNIFISAGTPFNEQQRAFRDSLIETIRIAGHHPRVIDVIDYPTEQPLKFVKKVLRECDGAIIAAYERIRVIDGLDKRKDPIRDTSIATPWNQIEAAMAYTLDMPIIVICHGNVRKEGLLDRGLDWYVAMVPDTAIATPPDLVARLMKWSAELPQRKQYEREDIDFDRLSLGYLVRHMSTTTLATGVTLIAAIIAVTAWLTKLYSNLL